MRAAYLGGVLLWACAVANCAFDLPDVATAAGSGGADAAGAAGPGAGSTGAAGGSTAATGGSTGAAGGSAGAGAGGALPTVGMGSTCKDVHDADSSAPSGVYMLDPDGPGGADPFEAYCEMEADGGGWTLVLKIDGNQQTFRWSADLWTNNSTYQPREANLDLVETKLASFSTVPLSAMRLGMIDGQTRWLVVSVPPSSSLSDLIIPGFYRATNAGRAAWEGLVASGSLELNCNEEGIDVVDGNVRIGFIGNDQMDCSTPDSAIGFGLDERTPCGNVSNFTSDNGDRRTATFGYVMVR